MNTENSTESNLVQLNSKPEDKQSLELSNKVNALESTVASSQQEIKSAKSKLESQLKKLETQDKSITKDIESTLTKIAEVESEVSQLYKDVDVTNSSINSSIENLERDHGDLSARVSETYKQLGSVEKTYKSLNNKSTKITAEIKKITTKVESIADSVSQQIADIEESTQSLSTQVETLGTETYQKSQQLTEGQEALIESTGSIIKEAKKTSKALTKSIKDNAALMKSLEQQLVTEIETLAAKTDKKSNKLQSNIDSANKEIKSHSAKMLLLQSVDEALDKRASQLELTSEELTKNSIVLFKETKKLDQRSTALEDSVEVLDIQVERLHQESEAHQAQIDELKLQTKETNIALKALAILENKHFKMASGFIALVLISVVALYFYQNQQWTNNSVTVAEQNKVTTHTINDLTDHVKTEDTLSATKINALETQVASLNQQLKTVNDNNQSLDQRLVNIAPHRQIGSDNVIHSQQWINLQSAENYSVKVAIAESKNDLFELAVRYNYYLKDVLSYHQKGDQFVLYMGQYSDKAQADLVIEKTLPFQLNGLTPELVVVKELQL